MGRLTFLAACIGGMPVFTFLVVVWLTGGAPLTPLGQASAAGPIDQGAVLVNPTALPSTGAKLSLIPQDPADAASVGSIVTAEPVTFGVAR